MSDDKTPPEGARYAIIDVGEMAKRAGQIGLDNRAEIAAINARLDRWEPKIDSLMLMAEKVDLLARPVARPRYVNYAVVMIAICALVMATASVVRTQVAIEAKAATR